MIYGVKSAFGAKAAKRKSVARRGKNDVFVVVIKSGLEELGVFAKMSLFIETTDILESGFLDGHGGAIGGRDFENAADFSKQVVKGRKPLIGGSMRINLHVGVEKVRAFGFESKLNFFQIIFRDLGVGVKKN